MNFTNKQKHILAFCAMVLAMIALITALGAEMYITMLGYIGAWQVGSWVKSYITARWPLDQKGE